MRRNNQILITAVEKYINDLQYIAKENKKSVNNMMNFLIINYIMHWTYSLGQDVAIFKKLSKTAEHIIAKDENLSHYIKDSYFEWGREINGIDDPWDETLNTGINRMYTHVNIPQRFQSNGLIFDEDNCKTIN